MLDLFERFGMAATCEAGEEVLVFPILWAAHGGEFDRIEQELLKRAKGG